MSRKKHLRILSAIFSAPVKSNIVWDDIEAMLKYFGAQIVERGGSKIIIDLNNTVGYFHRPHPRKETDKGAVVKFLTNAGVTPDGI